MLTQKIYIGLLEKSRFKKRPETITASGLISNDYLATLKVVGILVIFTIGTLLIFFVRAIVKLGATSVTFVKSIEGGSSLLYFSRVSREIFKDGGVSKENSKDGGVVSSSVVFFSLERSMFSVGGISDAKAILEETRIVIERAINKKIVDLFIMFSG